MQGAYYVETFSDQERARLAPHVTNLDGPVFALTGLPQVTCAALFARYSRSPKSLRRLLLDEFLGDQNGSTPTDAAAGAARASDLFSRVLSEYGDDSVAQLAGVHLACEQVSQPLAKAIEWGRLAAYLEQSTRYIPYTDKRDSHYRYYRDPDVVHSELGAVYTDAMDHLFDTYVAMLEPLQHHLDNEIAQMEDTAARKRAIRALSLDIARGLLPAGTVSNVGIFASPQSLEQLVMRLRAHPLPEAQSYAELIAGELQRTIPDFVARLDRPDRGGRWVEYLTELRQDLQNEASRVANQGEHGGSEVHLVDWDHDAEERIMANALFEYADTDYDTVLQNVKALNALDRDRLWRESVGMRGNRRHRPGRGFEHSAYTFEIVSDYGAFRDLQRHRMLTITWQQLSPHLGFEVNDTVECAGLTDTWRNAVNRAEDAYNRIAQQFPRQAQYLMTLGHRVRYVIRMNVREAMHMLELRTSPQAHPNYRRVCREMHRQIADVAGHHRIAHAMQFVGRDDVHLPRYAAEAKV